MYTNVRGVFRERVCEWYYWWIQLRHLPTMTSHGIEMTLQVRLYLFHTTYHDIIVMFQHFDISTPSFKS